MLVSPFCKFSKSETNDVDGVIGRAQVNSAVVNSYRQHDITSFMVFPSDFGKCMHVAFIALRHKRE